MIERELLYPIFEELYEIFDEDGLLTFYDNYQGITLNIPKRLYSTKKIQGKIAEMKKLGLVEKREDIRKIARKYNYSERQILRIIKNIQ
ncbi:hypothetical protein P7E02_05090 [Enterococcus hulanensis]|uniref:hypothetical protein n=1 Tax=Enterococcus hulanensis TaxID=2559929 RepID=UPI00288FB4CA|nr:hypothetical protein [Enterococcus hulanensis]MDT2659231.1 hypothetical protein [Enterococcus hulanensis]